MLGVCQLKERKGIPKFYPGPWIFKKKTVSFSPNNYIDHESFTSSTEFKMALLFLRSKI